MCFKVFQFKCNLFHFYKFGPGNEVGYWVGAVIFFLKIQRAKSDTIPDYEASTPNPMTYE